LIRSFADKATQDIYDGINTKEARRTLPKQLWERAAGLLEQLEAAQVVGDMRFPPGNRLKRLSGNRSGQWSVRINDQFRICFVFAAGDARNVEITDYH
jgi:proteic killer suppression protein